MGIYRLDISMESIMFLLQRHMTDMIEYWEIIQSLK